MAPNGALAGPCCDDLLRYELLRFLRRLSEADDVDPQSIKPCITDGLRNIREHLTAGSSPSAATLIPTTLFGECNSVPHNVEADDIPKFAKELSDAFKAIGGLSLIPDLRWQSNATIRGQLHQDNSVGVLVWSSPDLPVRVKQKIARWRTDALRISPLIIFYKASGQVPTNEPSGRRREDIAAAPGPGARSVAEPARLNRILEASLDELTEHLHQDTTDACVTALHSVLNQKRTEIDLREAP